MLRLFLIALPLVISSAAFAQQTAGEQALSIKLSAEINAGLQCSTSLISAQGVLAKLQARVKELEDKYEPKKEEPKK